MRTTDQDIIDFVVKRCGGRQKAADALGIDQQLNVSRGQSLTNWRARGLPPSARLLLWAWVRKHGLRLGEKWLTQSAAAHERKFTNGGGTSNGRTGKGKPRKAKARTQDQRRDARRGAQQRRTAGGDRQVAA